MDKKIIADANRWRKLMALAEHDIPWPDNPENQGEEFFSIPEHNLSMIEAQLSLFREARLKDVKDSQLEDLLIMIVTHLQGREIQ